jgi:predicted GIY-YIG superfamily endonuclease
MTFYLYILECVDGSYYTGHTDNLEKRMDDHAAGTCDSYTSSRRPVKLIYSAQFRTREEALNAERQIKGWTRAKKRAMIAGDWKEVARLGRASKERPSTGSGRTKY